MSNCEMTTAPALKPGTAVWRISTKSRAPLRALFMRHGPGGMVYLRSSTFSAKERRARAEDVFADREACRAEIARRIGLAK